MTARPPRATRSSLAVGRDVPARRPRPRALRRRHHAAASRCRATAGSGSPTGCSSSGDPAGPELHTHQAHYQGEMAVRMALGDDVTPDYRALPRATYTDPEAAFVGVTLDQAQASRRRRVRARRRRSRRRTKGYAVEATIGHVTIVVDRATRELVGAAMACPDASAAIHECVLAIKARVTMEVLADTIHAFPSTSRILNGLFADALRELRQAGQRRRLRGTRARLRSRPRRRRGRAAAAPSRARRRARPARSSASPGGRRGRRAGPGRGGRGRARRRSRPDRRTRPGAPVRATAPRPARTARASAGHEPSRRVTAIARPGHGSIGSTGRVRPEREHRAGVRDRPPRVAVRLRAVAPQPSRGRGVGAEMDRLDRGRDPGSGEPAAVVRVEQLDVLEAGHERQRAGGRLERVERGPHRRSRRSRGRSSRSRRPWALVASAASRSGGVMKTPRSVPAGSGLPSSASIGSRSAAVRDASVPSAKSFSQPRWARRASGQSGSPLRSPAADRRLDLLLADAGVDADGQRPALVERPERGDPGAQALLERQRRPDRGRRRRPGGRGPPASSRISVS